MTPLIFDVGRGSFVDGPGIRTVIFFKGCPLRCPWCQNPESQQPEAETRFDPKKCIGCGNCDTGCNSLARQKVGEYYSPRKLARIILRDKIFYRTSLGGVTFSGGEPLMFIDYLYEVAALLAPEKIHMAVETCGYFDYEKLETGLLPLLNLFLYDIKIMDPAVHERCTGKSNRPITRNLIRLLESGVEVEVRVPLIPGYTATEENLSAAAGFFLEHGIKNYSFLSYNPSGLEKWEYLGKKPPGNLPAKPMTFEEEQRWGRYFREKMNPGFSASPGEE